MRRKLISALLVALPVIVGSALAVLAYIYSSTYTVSNNSTINYGLIGVSVNASNTWMAANGFFHSTANDTRVETLGGIAQPHMVADNKTLAAVTVAGNSQTNLLFTAGNAELPSMAIITGQGGYVTTNDTAALELSGANWSVSGRVYVGTSANGTTRYTTNKTGALQLFENANAANFTANVTIPMTSSISAVGWIAPSQAWDNNIATASDYIDGGGGGMSNYLELGISPVSTSRVSFWADPASTSLPTDVDIYYSAAWHNVYSATPAYGVYQHVDFAPQTITGVRLATNDIFGGSFTRINEINVTAMLTVGSLTAGNKTVTLQSNGTNMWLTVDGQSSANYTAANVTNTANPYVWLQNVPYADYLVITVGGVEKLRYQPNTIIQGMILPDRDSTKNGDITWGSNLFGVTVTLGSLTSSAQPALVSSTTTPPRDILPVSNAPDLFGDGTVSGAVLTNPFRPLVTAVSDNTAMTEIQVWRLYGFGFWLVLTVWVMGKVRKHQLITGIVSAMCIIVMIVWNHNIFPMYLGFVSIGLIAAGWVAERSPVL